VNEKLFPLAEEVRLVGKPAVARRYTVCVRTVDIWMAQGVIPYQKIGGLVRFDLAKVDEALARFEVNARGAAA
jgi:hypothetical protein